MFAYIEANDDGYLIYRDKHDREIWRTHEDIIALLNAAKDDPNTEPEIERKEVA